MNIALVVGLSLIGLMFAILMVNPMAYLLYRRRQTKQGLGAETFIDWAGGKDD